MRTGKFKAFVVDKIVTENSKKNPQVCILLDVEFSENERTQMKYYGQLTDKAAEYTLKALVACGIQGNSVLDPITVGTEVSVVINEELNQDGKPVLKISWINKPMDLGTPIDETLGRNVLRKYEGLLAQMRIKNTPIKKEAESFANYSNEDIPY